MSADRSREPVRRARAVKRADLPTGPARDLRDLLYRLYLQADRPRLDDLAKRIVDDDELPGSPRRDLISKIISGNGLAGQQDTISVGLALAYASGRVDSAALADEIRRLWIAAQTQTPPVQLLLRDPDQRAIEVQRRASQQVFDAGLVDGVPKLAGTDINRLSLRSAVVAELDQPVKRRVTLFGAAGFGKTVLAIGLCRDQWVQQRFDRIYWFHVGRQPRLVTLLDAIHRAILGGPLDRSDISAAVHTLRHSNAGRRCLVVLDDVWDEETLTQLTDALCAATLIVTTRFARIVQDSACVEVGEATPGEAASMLTPTGTALDLAQRDLIATFAAELGNWPLLLSLASGRLARKIRGGIPLTKAIEQLRVRYRDLGPAGLQQLAGSDLLATAIDINLEDLHEQFRHRFFELGIFPVGRPIAAASASELWGSDPYATEDLLLELADRSVLRFELQSGDVVLHDAVHDAIRRRLQDAKQVHDRLLGAWDLERLPNPIAWRDVGYHLRAAGRFDRLIELLQSGPWLERKLAATSLPLLLDDLDAAADVAPTIDAVRRAVRRCLTGLTQNPMELRGQLHLRLTREHVERLAFDGTPPSDTGGHWLRAIRPQSEGSTALLACVMSPTPRGGSSAAITPDGKVIVACFSGQAVAFSVERPETQHVLLYGDVSCARPLPENTDCLLAGTSELIRVRIGDARRVWSVPLQSDRYDGPQTILIDAGIGVAFVLWLEGRIAAHALSDGRHLAELQSDGCLSAAIDTSSRTIVTSNILTACLIRYEAGDPMRLWPDGTVGDVRAVGGQGPFLLERDDGLHIGAFNDSMLVETPHDGPALATSLNGGLLVAGGTDGILRGWDVVSHDRLFAIRAQSCETQSVDIDEAGETIVTADMAGIVRVWSASQLRSEHMDESDSAGFAMLAGVDDGTIIGRQGGALVKLDPVTWVAQPLFSGWHQALFSGWHQVTAPMPDGSLYALRRNEKSRHDAQIVHIDAAATVADVAGVPGAGKGVGLLVGCGDIAVVDTGDAREAHVVAIRDGVVYSQLRVTPFLGLLDSTRYSPDAILVLQRKAVLVCDKQDLTRGLVIRHEEVVVSATLIETLGLVAVGDHTGITLYDMVTGERSARTDPTQQRDVEALLWCSAIETLVVGDRGGVVSTWSATPSSLTWTSSLTLDGQITKIESLGGARIAVAGWFPNVLVLDVERC
ncbi:NB-ARC domain-containing protein [Polymorphospora sp. NPDC050346]|uniref:NB-ARC domain-containing protein n=1 Tax=Polymorphospora sp. NPDC050346 TaxID=3155780 RepID=UPI0033E61683